MTGVEIFWIIAINIVAMVMAYVTGRSNYISSRKSRQPDPVYCKCDWLGEKTDALCCSVWKTCVSGFCAEHCEETDCKCAKAVI